MEEESSPVGQQTVSRSSRIISSAQAVTEHLERERYARQQLIRFGIPSMVVFLITGAVGFNYYGVFGLAAVISSLRFIFLRSRRVEWKTDDLILLFYKAAQAFRVQRGVKNCKSGDRVRVLLKRRYRRLKWPFPVIVLDQRWKKSDNQMFLIIGPTDHWWSGGNIWSLWQWSHRPNADLEFSKKTVTAQKQFLLEICLEKGLVWSLNFKNAHNRDQAYEALNAVRAIGRRQSANTKSDSESLSRKTNGSGTKHSSSGSQQHDSAEKGSAENKIDARAWHEVIGIKRNATIEEIQTAYKEAIKKCHPDTVASRSEIIKRAAVAETVELNAAYQSAKSERGF